MYDTWVIWIWILTDEKLDKVALKIISGLDSVEEQMAEKGIKFLHVDVNDVSEITVSSVPSLVYFKNGEPFVYEGKYLFSEINSSLLK